jgi:hypothetical protein
MNHQYTRDTIIMLIILLILEILREKPTLPTNTISPKIQGQPCPPNSPKIENTLVLQYTNQKINLEQY